MGYFRIGISFTGKAEVAFDAIPLPCPQSMLLKPTQFPSLECSDFRFRALLPFGQVFPRKTVLPL